MHVCVCVGECVHVCVRLCMCTDIIGNTEKVRATQWYCVRGLVGKPFLYL